MIHPPSVGPRIGATMTVMPNAAIAIPRCSGGKVSSMTPWADGWRPPPDMPWMHRKMISSVRLVAMPQAIDAAVNTAALSRT